MFLYKWNPSYKNRRHQDTEMAIWYELWLNITKHYLGLTCLQAVGRCGSIVFDSQIGNINDVDYVDLSFGNVVSYLNTHIRGLILNKFNIFVTIPSNLIKIRPTNWVVLNILNIAMNKIDTNAFLFLVSIQIYSLSYFSGNTIY